MQERLRIAINGFGRIGRILTRIAWETHGLHIVAINSRSDADIYAHLLKYDSVYGPWDHEVSHDGNDALVIDGVRIPLHHENELENAPWGNYDVDVVIESTGVFRDRASSEKHLEAGAKHVVISAPATDEDISLLYNINHELFDPGQHKIISAVSCTTTCLAPLVTTLHEAFGIEHGTLLTAHAYTNDQHLVDHPHRKHDFRRCRAAGLSIIPSKTGATKAIVKLIPELEGKLHGMALRVPVEIVSAVHFVAELQKDVTKEEVNNAFRKASKGAFAGSLDVTELPLVSVDHTRMTVGSLVDTELTEVTDKRQVSVLSWYDNEWGYVSQMVKLLEHIRQKTKK